MASCPPASSAEQGFATPAALVFALALALVSAALVTRSVMLLRLSKADLARVQVEYVLDGVQLAAAAAVVRAGAGGPYRWAYASDGGWVDIVAESEAEKVDLATAARLDERVFQAFGVADPGALRTRLASAGAALAIADVGALDAAPLWRACAASAISSLGRRSDMTAATPSEPQAGPAPPAWRVGEMWRMRATTAAGWRDDRIVRFTGDARHPAAVVVRRLSRGDGGQGQCDEVLAAAA